MVEDPPLQAPEDFTDSVRRNAVRRVRNGFALLGTVIGVGTLGYVVHGWGLGDALYMVMITVSTVGFGEVRPIDTVGLRVHTILIMLFGYVAAGYVLTSVLALFTEEELRRLLGTQRVKRQIEALQGHTVVAGMGRMGALVCSELDAAGVPFVAIDRDPKLIAELDRRGWLHVLGEATEDKVLLEAGLARAGALVSTLPSDADNVFITLTARDLAPAAQIIARAEQPSTEKKLQQAGADHVVLPASIGAQRITSILTNPAAAKFADLVAERGDLAFRMSDVEVRRGGPFAGRTLRDLDIGRRTGVMVIAVKRGDGRVEFPPSGDGPFNPGDGFVLLGRSENLERFRAEFGG